MNTISYLWTNGNNKDFQSFYQKTEEYYSKIAGGLENRKDFVPYNISDTIEVVLIAFIDNKAIACAGLKRYSDTDAEIKRVWVEPEFRGNHISADMMDLLEKKALEQGFKRTILQTRPQMESAIHIYTMLGYEKIDNYPPYDKLDGAICLAKKF